MTDFTSGDGLFACDAIDAADPYAAASLVVSHDDAGACYLEVEIPGRDVFEPRPVKIGINHACASALAQWLQRAGFTAGGGS